MNTLPVGARRMMWVVGALGLAGFLITAADALTAPSAWNWAKAADQLGCLLIVAAMAIPNATRSLRTMLISVAVLLIVPGTAFIFWHAF